MIDDAHVLDLIREATKAAVERALSTGVPVKRPGTVETFDPITQICGVVIDGDTEATPGIPNWSGTWPHRGTRVVVEFRPPSGMAVVHVNEPKGVPHCTCYSSGAGAGAAQSVTGGAGATLLTNTDTIEGLTDYFDLTAGVLTVVVPGWYDLNLGITADPPAAGTGRRFAGLQIDGSTTRLGVADSQEAATGQWIARGVVSRELDAGSTIQPRALTSVTTTFNVNELSARWKARRTTVS